MFTAGMPQRKLIELHPYNHSISRTDRDENNVMNQPKKIYYVSSGNILVVSYRQQDFYLGCLDIILVMLYKGAAYPRAGICCPVYLIITPSYKNAGMLLCAMYMLVLYRLAP